MESKIFKSPLIKTSGRKISSSSISSSGSKRDVTSVLTEINRILVEIQKQLSLDFAMRAAEEKKEKRDNKISESRKRFKKEESVLEKTSKKIRKSVGKASEKIVSPAVNIFDKILEFVGLLGAGIAVNAAFKWFEDEENRKKLVKFFNILKENWQLVAKILGTLVAGGVLLKAAGAILTIGKVLSILSNPIALGFIAGAGLLFGMKAGVDLISDAQAGGREFNVAHKALDQKLFEAGMNRMGGDVSDLSEKQKNRSGGGRRGGRNEEQEKIYQSVISGREQLRSLQKQKDTALEGVEDDMERRKIYFQYASQIPGIVSGIKPRAMGGPVSAGIPYLVGERGPEIFAPNVDGSIINNMRTEKIYQMISSDIEGDIDFIELPPITNKIPPPNVPSLEQATDVPMISSTNSADPYLQVSPKLYGVMV